MLRAAATRAIRERANPAVMSTIAELADVVAECIRANVAVVGDHRDVDGGATNNKRARREDRAPDDDGSNRKKKSHGRAAVFIAGAGTSGRLAFLAARTANDTLTARGKPPCFHHIIAGGTPALFSAESATTGPPPPLTRRRASRQDDIRRPSASHGLSATYVSHSWHAPWTTKGGSRRGFQPQKFASANQPGDGGGGGGGVRAKKRARKRRQGGTGAASATCCGGWRRTRGLGASSSGGGRRLRRRHHHASDWPDLKVAPPPSSYAHRRDRTHRRDEDARRWQQRGTTSALVKELVAGAAATRADPSHRPRTARRGGRR